VRAAVVRGMVVAVGMTAVLFGLPPAAPAQWPSHATPAVPRAADGKLIPSAPAPRTRDGKPGRERAQADALQAARMLAALGCATLLVDTSPQPTAAAQTLALAMNARYLALPYAAAQLVSNAVRAQRG